VPDITITLSDDDYERLCEKAKQKMATPEREARVILRQVLHFFDTAGGKEKWTQQDADWQARWSRGG
jgi:hypothetical protein